MSVVKPHTHIPDKYLSANLVCLSNGFVKNCLVSTHDECEETSHWCRTNILWHSLNYRHPRERYRMRTKAFAIAHSLLSFRPHILILDERMCSFSVHSIYVYTALEECKSLCSVWWNGNDATETCRYEGVQWGFSFQCPNFCRRSLEGVKDSQWKWNCVMAFFWLIWGPTVLLRKYWNL